MKARYEVTDKNGNVVARALTNSAIRERLLHCKSGEDYNVSGGLLGDLTGKKTTLRNSLRTEARFLTAMHLVRREETADSVIFSFPHFPDGYFADVLELAAVISELGGFEVEDIGPTRLTVKKKRKTSE